MRLSFSVILVVFVIVVSSKKSAYPSGLDHPSYLDPITRPMASVNDPCHAVEDRYLEYISRLEEIAYQNAFVERDEQQEGVVLKPKSIAQHLLSALQSIRHEEDAVTNCESLGSVLSTSFSYIAVGSSKNNEKDILPEQQQQQKKVNVALPGADQQQKSCELMFKRHAARNNASPNDQTYSTSYYREGDMVVVKNSHRHGTDVMFLRFYTNTEEQQVRLLSVEDYTAFLSE